MYPGRQSRPLAVYLLAMHLVDDTTRLCGQNTSLIPSAARHMRHYPTCDIPESHLEVTSDPSSRSLSHRDAAIEDPALARHQRHLPSLQGDEFPEVPNPDMARHRLERGLLAQGESKRSPVVLLGHGDVATGPITERLTFDKSKELVNGAIQNPVTVPLSSPSIRASANFGSETRMRTRQWGMGAGMMSEGRGAKSDVRQQRGGGSAVVDKRRATPKSAQVAFDRMSRDAALASAGTFFVTSPVNPLLHSRAFVPAMYRYLFYGPNGHESYSKSVTTDPTMACHGYERHRLTERKSERSGRVLLRHGDVGTCPVDGPPGNGVSLSPPS
ncbi:uncharacterized protein B0H18DRAFT_955322 [Fomitopsis serialis]|uniref:uncharacterized protein n=1 Tax=Fomitopsis serialis TaxID=139415 RepID=UPI002008E2DC|nr:uncharacterized protein B0H18DRAFT_955322 [Neoantrodia serialis]KAH9924935.1 hypothetical protein B0H18DRAFT_955322 [Neoantrodia serialis]